MKLGDWVFFKTRNWPKEVRVARIDSSTGEAEDITGQGFYEGRGKIIGIAGGNYTVREEKTNRLVEVGPHPEDEIRPLRYDFSTLTLGDLRAFLEEHKDAPDDIPVTITLPLAFFSDEDDLPADHPEYKAMSACQSVEACGISFLGISENDATSDGYISPEEREGEDWEFFIEIMPNSEQCFDAMRDDEEE